MYMYMYMYVAWIIYLQGGMWGSERFSTPEVDPHPKRATNIDSPV
jgi:hypothetical protein